MSEHKRAPDEEWDRRSCFGCFENHEVVTEPVTDDWGYPDYDCPESGWHGKPICEGCEEEDQDAINSAAADAESDGIDDASDYEG